MKTFLGADTTHRLIAVALAGSAAGAAIGAGAPQVIGIDAAILNNVRQKPAGAAQAHIPVVRERVGLGDEVQTGGRSQMQLLLLDKSTFTIGADARLTIDRFVYDPDRGVRTMGASLVRGAFRFISARPDKAGTTQIRTPVATIGVRGTIVEGVVGRAAAEIASAERVVNPRVRIDPATASLIILRGPGPRTQGRVSPGAIDVTAGGRTVTADRPMRAIFVPFPGAAPIGPFVISASGLTAMQALLFPSLAQRFGLPVPGERPFVPYEGGAPSPGYLPPPPGAGQFPGGEGGRPRGSSMPYPGGQTFPGSGYNAPAMPSMPAGRRTTGTRGTQTMSPAAAPTPAPQATPTATPTPRPSPSPTANQPGAYRKP